MLLLDLCVSLAVLLSVFGGRLAEVLLEDAAEVAHVVEAAGHGDLANGAVVRGLE